MRSKLMNWLLVLVVLISTVAPVGRTATAAGDKTGILTNLSAVVKQGDKVIGPTDKINGKEPIEVIVSFGVPVAGDDPVPPEIVEHGDTASILLSEGFSALPESIPPLMLGSKKLADAQLSQAGNTVTADVYFNGDTDIFGGDLNNVSGGFTAKLQYNASGSAGNEGDHTVTILGKDYTVNIPPAEIVYNVGKSGTVSPDKRTIDWEVEVTVTQGVYSPGLKDYIFRDNLTGVGELVAGSFKVNGASVTPDSVTGNVIQYTFPDNSASPQTVTFTTNIPEDLYYSTNSKSISNTAELLKDDVVVKNGSKAVDYTPPTWITKNGVSNQSADGVYDPDKQEITWTIIANQAKADLKNLTITDQLDKELDFESAEWAISSDGSNWSPVLGKDTPSFLPENKYSFSFGDTNDQVKLTIVTKVKAPVNGITTGKTSFTNRAELSWEGKLQNVHLIATSNEVGIGYEAITKQGKLNKDQREITWDFNVNARGQNMQGMKVYDLLVHGNSFDLAKVDEIPGYSKAMIGNLKPNYGLKFISTGSSNVKDTKIWQEGKHVADLVEVEGLSTSVSGNQFSFTTRVVDPDIFAGNKDSIVSNTASLYLDTTKLRDALGEVPYQSRTLKKELLSRGANPETEVNNSITDAALGFNYIDKSVIYRLSINADGLDFSAVENAENKALGAVTVTDTLPEGWEFVDVVPGKEFLIFKGNGKADGSVEASGNALDSESLSGFKSDFVTTTGKATFTFDHLNEPFVILVKAKPNESVLADYFKKNDETRSVTNQISLSATEWDKGVNQQQAVSIPSKVLTKDRTKGNEAGTLKWTVNYNPYELSHTGEKIEDTLPIGLDLRMNSKGELLLKDEITKKPYITVKEMILNADGGLTEGDEVTLELNKNVFYDNANRILTFLIPDGTKAYSFNYLTDITGDPGEVSNTVKLSSGTSIAERQEKSYSITSADSWATMQRGGSLEITKVDGLTQNPLQGAEFTLFAEDGSTVIRKIVTKADGKVTLRAIPGGDYILKETAAPGSYQLSEAIHTVSVDTSGSPVLTSIDGKTGTDSNKLTVKNSKTGTAGNLEITKTVAGNDGDSKQKFGFTINLPGTGGSSYDYSLIGADKKVVFGTIKDGDKFSLAHDEKILITGLPKDTEYTVTESEASANGYVTGVVNADNSSTAGRTATGTIAADETQTAVFTNTKDKPGSLVVSKTVTGNAGDKTKKFDFTITFNAAGDFKYTGDGVAANSTIRSGDTVSLAHGESITIAGLPKDTSYEVIEGDYSKDGYTTSSTGDKGQIATDDIRTAAFVNTRNVYVSPQPGPGPDPGPGISQPSDPSGQNEGNKDPESEQPKPEQPDSEQPQPGSNNPEDSGGNKGDSGNGDRGAAGSETPNGEDQNSGNHGGAALGAPDAVQNGTGTPKTGDFSSSRLAQFGLIFFLLALAGLFWADSALRGRRQKQYPNSKS